MSFEYMVLVYIFSSVQYLEYPVKDFLKEIFKISKMIDILFG